MADGKRKRSPNWLPSEKQLLLDLVENHFSVIENKKTDGVSIKGKLAEWQLIANEYNSATTHCHRGADNLKAQWESMKKSAKKEASNARMRFMKTGGGPPDPRKEDSEYLRIIRLIKTSAVGLHNPFDGDSVIPVRNDIENMPIITSSESETITDSTSNKNIDNIICRDGPLLEIIKNNDSNVDTAEGGLEIDAKDWGDYTHKLLRTPVSASLKVFEHKEKAKMSRRRPIHSVSSSSIEQLHHKKMEAIDFQTQLAAEERKKCGVIEDLNIQIKKEILKQEKIKTRLLLLELRLKNKQLNNN